VNSLGLLAKLYNQLLCMMDTIPSKPSKYSNEKFGLWAIKLPKANYSI
jgi:hypothetical protein